MSKRKRMTIAFLGTLAATLALVPAAVAAPGPGSPQCTGGPAYPNPHCRQHH